MSTPRTHRSDAHAGRHPAQWLAAAIGAIYTIVGLAGFVVTGIDGFAEPEGELLLGIFEVNPLHNVVHLVIGLAGLATWTRLRSARSYGWLLAVGYGAVFVYGLLVAGTSGSENFLALNWADNWLHVVSAVAGLAIALWPAARSTTRSDAAGTMPTSDDTRRRARH